MNIEAKEFELKMTYGELWTIAFNMQSALIHTLETHWINHQQTWLQNESERLKIIKSMFVALGRPELHEIVFEKAKIIFENWNERTNQSEPKIKN